jgi:LmbE family N-acetylglucosaminyl deacetylase
MVGSEEGVPQRLPMLEQSALVVAHPDDEILWFSSIVKHVDRVIICFLTIEGEDQISEGRKRALSAYPRGQVTELAIPEAVVYDYVDWQNPHPTNYGLELRDSERGSRREGIYSGNFAMLFTRLKEILTGYQNVITHNPWGEYGHAEHVQVYRAVRQAQRQHGFDLWYSNYCSNKSFRLASSYISGYRSDYITLSTGKAFATEVRNLYFHHGCWTWYDDYEWFNEESFIRDNGAARQEGGHGHYFPLNVVKIKVVENDEAWRGRRARLVSAFARLLGLPEPPCGM